MVNKSGKVKKISGVAARQWRQKLASTAERCDDTMRTLKFPLELQTQPSWEEAQRLYKVIASDAHGSVIHFLYTLLLGGFRVFGKQAETEVFRNKFAFDDAEWRVSVLEKSGLTVARDAFIPSEVYKRLLISPRSVGGKDSGFKPEIVAIEYAKFFCKGKHGDAIPEPEKILFHAIAVKMANRFDSWKSLCASQTAAAEVIDEVLADLGYGQSSRSLAVRMGAIRTYEPAGTVAFDPESQPFIEYEGIASNLIVARALKIGRSEGLSTKPELTKFCQEFVSGDANHGGLAWLFGKGLVSYFQTVTVDQMMSDFDVPSDRQIMVEGIISAVRAIPDASHTLLGGKNYASYRSGIGGTLASWIANYITRLFDLDEVLSTEVESLVLPPDLLADERLFAEIGISPAEIEALGKRALDDRSVAYASLSKLSGASPEHASCSDVEVVEAYNSLLDTLAGLLSALQEKIKKSIAIAEATHDEAAVKLMSEGYVFTVPKWIKRLEKLNRLTLTRPDPGVIVDESSQLFSKLNNAMHVHYGRIREWSVQSGETLSPLVRIEAREANYVRQTGSKRNPGEQAFRACLDMIGRSARLCSDVTLQKVVEFFSKQNIFTEISHLNQYFYNRRGMIFKKAQDKNPRSAYPITLESLADAPGMLERYAQFIAALRLEIMSQSQPNLRQMIDLFQLERGHFAMLLMGFPDEIPSELAIIDEVKEIFNLPLPVKLRLTGITVSSAVMRQIFNAYYVQLESLASILLREKFFVRVKFQRAGENALIYVPGDKQAWAAPDLLFDAPGPIGVAMRRLESAAGSRDPVDVPLALAFLCDSTENTNDPSMRAYMKQAPHDWYFPWPGGSEVKGLYLDKTGLGKRLATASAARLIGARAYKGVLAKMLSNPEDVEIGDAAILIDQTFIQTAKRDEDGKIVVTIAPSEIKVTAALPIKESHPQKTSPSFKRYVAIDLGERGFGYAVFEADTHQLFETGKISVRSMRYLVMDDRAGRRKVSDAPKFMSPFDPAEERRRKNVVGDFCHAINRLMWFYDAFPVFEHVAGGASKPIDKIYKAVADRYLYSTTPTVDSVRKSYWTGASFWKHPTLQQYKFDKTSGKKSAKVDALTLFPGVSVSGFATSQECSCCHRNPIADVRQMQADAGKPKGAKGDILVAIDNGEVRLASGKAVLMLAEKSGAARSRNERTPLTRPADNVSIKGEDLIRLIRRNIRQAPKSLMSQDTTQSVYQCVYEDCGQVQNAEINAGINLGRRFASDRPSAS